jgi:hypothetical protein
MRVKLRGSVRARSVRAVVAVAAAAVLGAASAPSGAVAASGDAAATQAYVRANYSALRVAISRLAAAEAAPLHVLAQVRGECPGAGARSPQNGESTQMSDEVIGAMVLGAAQPYREAIATYLAAVARLRWSDPGLTRAIRAYAADWKTLLALPAPNLCADVRAWAADGFHALPASTVTFVAKFMLAWVGAGFLPAQLGRYESAATKALAARSERLEEQVSDAEARAVEPWGRIMDALEIWP